MSTDWGMTKVTQAIKSKRDSNQQVSQGQPSQQIKLCTPHFCYSHCGCVYFLSCTVYARCDMNQKPRHDPHSPQHNPKVQSSSPNTTKALWVQTKVPPSPHNDILWPSQNHQPQWKVFRSSKIQYSCQVLTSQPSKLVLVCKWLWTKGWGIVFCASLHHQQLVG